MIRKTIAALLVLLSLGIGCTGVWLALTNLGAEPVLLEVPQEAKVQAMDLLDALCKADYTAVSRCLYGQPDLGMDGQPADDVGRMFFEAYAQSLRYELVRDCYATSEGVALDVCITALDVDAALQQLRQQAQELLQQRVAEAEDVSQVYDESGEYLESLVEAVLRTSASQVLQEGSTVRTQLTLECVFRDGKWWILPSDALLDIIGCKLD
jgi:hypothetical protein